MTTGTFRLTRRWGHMGFDHIWFWKSKLPERKGQRCRVLVRGKMNSVLVEFQDGYRVITSKWAVREENND